MKKPSFKSVLKFLAWSTIVLAILLFSLGLWVVHSAEARLGVVRVSANQWGKHVLKYSDDYRLQHVTTVSKFYSTTMMFRRMVEPYTNIEVVILSTPNAQADQLMFNPPEKDTIKKIREFKYRGRSYPLMECKWTTKALADQDATLLVVAIELSGKHCFLKSFRPQGPGDWKKEFTQFADTLIFPK